jgi:hypothetical protein
VLLADAVARQAPLEFVGQMHGREAARLAESEVTRATSSGDPLNFASSGPETLER